MAQKNKVLSITQRVKGFTTILFSTIQIKNGQWKSILHVLFHCNLSFENIEQNIYFVPIVHFYWNINEIQFIRHITGRTIHVRWYFSNVNQSSNQMPKCKIILTLVISISNPHNPKKRAYLCPIIPLPIFRPIFLQEFNPLEFKMFVLLSEKMPNPLILHTFHYLKTRITK